MSKTYLELVNDAIDECKCSLDPLTAANFNDPPRTTLYRHFKRWANSVYKELMIERPQWFFRTERTTVLLQPRLHLSGLSYIPSVGDVLIGTTSGTTFTVLGVYLFEDNEADPSIERTVDVQYADGSDPRNFEINETLDMVSPTPNTGVGYVAHAGRYNFSELVEAFDEMDLGSVKSFQTGTNIGARVTPVDWVNWVNRYEYYPYGTANSPEYISRAPDGNYEVFPQPLIPFHLEFDYSRSYTDMVNHDDTPVGVPEKYEDILVWLTVAEYADFDNNTRLFARANKKLTKYDYYLVRDKLPSISFARSKFDIDYGW